MMGKSNRGYVLVCVLWLLAIMTVITIGFGRRAMLDRRTAGYALDYSQAMFLARGAVERGLVELRNKASIDKYFEEEGYTGYNQLWSRPMNMLETGQYFSSMSGEEFSEDFCLFSIQDEESRISLNSAPNPLLENVKLLGLPAFRRIMKRRTERPYGSNYQVFNTVEELRAIPGITDELWEGDGYDPGLKELFTCWGDGKINVNTASPEVLSCVPHLKENVISAIIAYRAGPDGQLYTEDDLGCKNFEELVVRAKLSQKNTGALRQYCKLNSQYFTIRGYATQRNGKVMAYCSAIASVSSGAAVVLQWREGIIGS